MQFQRMAAARGTKSLFYPDAVTLVLGAALATSLILGRTANPFGAFLPLIISRQKQPLLYWCEVSALALITVFTVLDR